MAMTQAEAIARIETAREAGETTLKLPPLERFPRQLFEFEELRELYLVDGWPEVPASIGELQQLERLFIGCEPTERWDIDTLDSDWSLGYWTPNEPTVIPPDLGRLQRLRSLAIMRGWMRQSALGSLSCLEELFLRDYWIDVGPERQAVALDGLRKLAVLEPGGGHGGVQTFHAPKLHSLLVGDVDWRQLPDWLRRSQQLQVLSLISCPLESLPSWLGQLDLRKLYLEEAEFEAIALEFDSLAMLRQLFIRRTPLRMVPPAIESLRKLQVLDLSGTQIRALPIQLRRLPDLRTLQLHDTALGLPPELLGSRLRLPLTRESFPDNANAILQYYFQQKRPLHEAKILIVGQGGVGKSSLVKQLIENQFDEREATTEGIDIVGWQVPLRGEDGRLRVNIWDFGGQEIMHATHQFFLTKRSLYILVLDARGGEHEGRLYKWLKLIQSFGGNSPVLVVVNKIDAHVLDLNETRVAKDYAPNIHGFHYISCATGAGIDELRQALTDQLNGLPHVHDVLPVSYFQVKSVLEQAARERDYLDRDAYLEICRQSGVTDAREQEHLLRFLHDLGGVLNYADADSPYDLADTNILDPEWVTQGVYRIINDKQLMEAGGRLRLADLGRMLEDGRYPPERRRFIIGMMHKFELCLPFPESQGRELLIPELLSRREPDLDWREGDALVFRYEYRVLPEGLIPRFIVRMHHKLTAKPTYWRHGVVLGIEGCRVMVRGDSQEGVVHIAVLGPRTSRRYALSVVRDAFDAIHRTIPALLPRQTALLPGRPDIVLDYEELLGLERMGEAELAIAQLQRRVPLREILDGFESEERRRVPGQSVFRLVDGMVESLAQGTTTGERPPVDALIVTALQDELDAVLALAERVVVAEDERGFPYHTFALDRLDARGQPTGRRLRLAAAWSGEMGELAAADRARTLIDYLQPACLAMSGICAGNKSDIELGDVIVADRVYNYDHGKLVAYIDDAGVRATEVFQDVDTYKLEGSWGIKAANFARDPSWQTFVDQRPLSLRYQREWLLRAMIDHEDGSGCDPEEHPQLDEHCPDWSDVLPELERRGLIDIDELCLTESGRKAARRHRRLYRQGVPMDRPFQAVIGPIATGSKVVQDGQLFARLKRAVRKTVGVEMEANAIGFVAERAGILSLIAKAVSDHGDGDKDDRFRQFASRASATFVVEFLRRHLPTRY